MKVEVMPSDISKGIPGILDACPVALAVLRAYGSSTDAGVTVDETEILIFSEADGSTVKVWDTPGQVSDIISHYDDTCEMYPFGFEL
jgi:hypothetical protein